MGCGVEERLLEMAKPTKKIEQYLPKILATEMPLKKIANWSKVKVNFMYRLTYLGAQCYQVAKLSFQYWAINKK